MKSKKIKGVVVEIKEYSCIVMTTGGLFEEVKLPGKPVQLGEEIESTIKVQSPWINMKKYIIAAAVLFVVAISSLQIASSYFGQPVAYVSLDINPSIELGIDSRDRIVSARGLNTEGNRLLEKIDIQRIDLYQGISLIMQEAIEQGYIKENTENIVFSTMVYEDNKKQLLPIGNEKIPVERHVHLQKISDTIDRELNERGLESRVIAEEIEPKQRDTAMKKGISPGKLLFIEKAQQNNIQLDLNEVKKKNIRQIGEEKKIDMEKLFPGSKKGTKKTGKMNTGNGGGKLEIPVVNSHGLKNDQNGWAGNNNILGCDNNPVNNNPCNSSKPGSNKPENNNSVDKNNLGNNAPGNDKPRNEKPGNNKKPDNNKKFANDDNQGFKGGD